jgi:hypothetical protein
LRRAVHAQELKEDLEDLGSRFDGAPDLEFRSATDALESKLAATLTSTKKSKGARLKFSKAAFYIGKGVEHKHHKHGKVVINYTANATKHHVPATVDLSLAGLKPGTHTLKVVLSYKQTKREHGHKKTVTVTKTMNVTFSVC